LPRNPLCILYLCVYYNITKTYIHTHICMSGVLCKFIVNILVLTNIKYTLVVQLCIHSHKCPWNSTELTMRFVRRSTGCVCEALTPNTLYKCAMMVYWLTNRAVRGVFLWMSLHQNFLDVYSKTPFFLPSKDTRYINLNPTFLNIDLSMPP